MRARYYPRAMFAAILAFVVVTAVPAKAAPGCDTAHPTRLGGTIHGYPDNRALNAFIGVDMRDAGNVQVDPDGRRRGDPLGQFCGGYSWCEWVNPGVPPEGSTETLDRDWGRCVASPAVRVYLEIYPRNQEGRTTKTRYGAASHYNQPITVGGTNTIGLRLPVTYEAGNGNTGGVHGYLTYRGHRIPPENIGPVRAFTYGRGPECGVEGFSAAADELAYSNSMDATWYKVAYLAGGRCGATAQTYSIRVTCKTFCGADSKTLRRDVGIEQGRYWRVDLAFS